MKLFKIDYPECEAGSRGLAKAALATAGETAGAKMVQALQAMRGIDESMEVSMAGWRRMTQGQRCQTIEAYKFFYERRN